MDKDDSPGWLHDPKKNSLLTGIILFSIALIFFVDIITPLAFAIWILYFIPLFLTLYTRWKNGPFVITSLIILLMCAGAFLSPVDISPLIDILNRVFFIVLVSALAFLITHYRQNVEDLRKSEEGLMRANKKLNLLSSITRHDIVNQIFALKGFLSLLKKETNEPALIEYINRSDKATRTIENQIIFTRDYQDMGIKAPSWQNVKKSMINAKGALPIGSVTVAIDCSDLELFADPLFDKVFYNLIDNSLKHGGDRLTTIRIRAQETDNRLIMTCEDDGAGIRIEDRPFIFDHGFGKNTGLGLFLIREILDITGITIRETGEPGKGARFEIIVPKEAYRFRAAN